VIVARAATVVLGGSCNSRTLWPRWRSRRPYYAAWLQCVQTTSMFLV